jgi:hypothetical protein
MLITGIDVDIEVRSKNKDDKAGSAQKECNKKDGKNGSEEKNTSPMEVDDKHDNEANAARSERETPESEGWTVVNDTAASRVVNDTTANHVVNDTSANQSMNLIFCIFYMSCLE